METPKKKPYSNPYLSLEYVWHVLREYASEEHPLTVQEIYAHIVAIDKDTAPSLSTLRRILPQGGRLMGTLFSRELASTTSPTAFGYASDDQLHVVLEHSDGVTLQNENLSLELGKLSGKLPTCSTLEKLLKTGVFVELDSFPYVLTCVARTKDRLGRVRQIPYADYENQLKADTNNMPRRYYLKSPLTEGEWRIFTDMVQTYPFITQNQAAKFLSVLDRLHLPSKFRPQSRYAYRQGSGNLFSIIDKLDEAIQERHAVRICYGQRVLTRSNGRWVPKLQPKASMEALSLCPYTLLWSNGNYYLVAAYQNRLINLRVDRILSVTPLTEQFTIPQSFDPAEYRDSCPVMYCGEAAFVHLRCRETMVNTLVDFFGSKPQYTAPIDGWTEVTMQINPDGVKLFALQYADSVEVLQPLSLRENIIKTLDSARAMYAGTSKP